MKAYLPGSCCLARVLAGLAIVLLPLTARAVGIQSFDPNGSMAGCGIINGATYAWDGPSWSWSSGGTTVYGDWIQGSFAEFNCGAPVNSYTVLATNTEVIAGLASTASGVSLTLSASGAGALELVSGMQGFINNGGILKITAPLIGAGGFAPEGSGSFWLYGSNTYSGGTLFGASGSPLVWFNNSNSFGTGPVTNGTTTTVLDPDATGPITIFNWVSAVTGMFSYSGPAVAPVTWSGPWTLATGTLTNLVGSTSFPTSQMTISGPISGLGGSLVKNGTGTLILAGSNTYSGSTSLTAGTLEIAGSIAGNVANTGGVLQLDSASALSSRAVVALVSSLPSGAVNLHFSGAQSIMALQIDGVAQPSGTWGALGSGAQNTSPLFTGSGQFKVLGPPAILQEPVSWSVYPESSYTFSVSVPSDPSLTYQWKFNGANIAGANGLSYTVSPAEAPNAGSYSCWLTNSYGWTNTIEATLTILATTRYVNVVRGDHPLAYWRLDETAGTLANDWVGGNVGQYVNVLLNQPGYSYDDPDPAISLPANASARGYVLVTNSAPFSFPGATPFSVEAWACFTNLSGVQRLFSTFSLTPPNGWAFGLNGANALVFTSCAVQDAQQPLDTPLVPGVWYYLACTCDGTNYHFYVNGQERGFGVAVEGGGITGVSAPLTLGCNPPAFVSAEQLYGRLDEAAIYNYALSAGQIRARTLGKISLTLGNPGLPGLAQVQYALTNPGVWGFSVLGSSNLVDWDYLGTASAQFTDPAASNAPMRFYRLRSP